MFRSLVMERLLVRLYRLCGLDFTVKILHERMSPGSLRPSRSRKGFGGIQFNLRLLGNGGCIIADVPSSHLVQHLNVAAFGPFLYGTHYSEVTFNKDAS